MQINTSHNGEKFITELVFGKQESLPHVLDLIRYDQTGSEIRIPLTLHQVSNRNRSVSYKEPNGTIHEMKVTPCLVTA